jgi:ubiquinone/menaquinone biosynthesis C-methylase UbiE
MSDLAEAYGLVAAAEAARSSGLFDMLAAKPATAAEAARALGLDPSATAAVLMMLSSVGLVEEGAGRFSANGVESVVSTMHIWDGLPTRLERGEVLTRVERPGGADAHYRHVVRAMAEMLEEPSRHAADHLRELGPEVIDVGCGAATWSLPLVRQRPDLSVTLMDRPPVLAAARERVADAGVLDSFAFVPTNIASDDLGVDRCDLAMVGNVCHLFGETDNKDMFSRMFAALRRGGTIAVIDVTPEDYGSSRGAALHALSLVVRTKEGGVHAFTAYGEWLREAGFRDVSRQRLRGEPHGESLILARKP